MLKKILIGLALLLALLFAVQIVDTALHKDDYAKVDSADKKLMDIEKRHSDCLSVLSFGFSSDDSGQKKLEFEKFFNDKQLIRNVQTSCIAAAAEVRDINTDDVKFLRKKQQFRDLQKNYEMTYTDLALGLGVWAKCSSYDNECKKLVAELPVQTVMTPAKLLRQLLEFHFRPTVPNFILYPVPYLYSRYLDMQEQRLLKSI